MTEKEFITEVKRQLRLKKAYTGMSYEEIADKTGISLQTIAATLAPSVENNTRILTLKYICDAFGITLSQLFDNEKFAEPIGKKG